MSSLKYWLWLSTRSGIGLVRAKALLEYFGSPDNIFHASDRDFLDINGIKQNDIEQLMNKDLSAANEILSSCAEVRCRIVTLFDSDYPERLRNIYDPPLLLYLKGRLPYIDDEPVVGVVGSRKCTPYGLITAENVAYTLSNSGFIIVTGMALGIDTAAAKGALRAGGQVIGVVGSGLDIIYPPENSALFDDVSYTGAIISEYPPGTVPAKQNFPARNRIISGLSLGVAVIEAPIKSGALITASNAMEQGRDVFTLPGNVDAAACKGSNNLLRDGAIPFLSPDDIISEYLTLFPEKIKVIDNKNEDINNRKKVCKEKRDQKKSIDNESKVDYIDLGNLLEKLNDDEKTIVMSIEDKSVDADDLILMTGFPAKKVLSILTMLELAGHVGRNDYGKWEITA